MFQLNIEQLAEITGGQLRLAAMPPLAGTFEPVREIVIESRDAGPGAVFWGLQGTEYEGKYWAEDAFARGALGAVVTERHLEPWAGKFSLETGDANQALCRLAKCLPSSCGLKLLRTSAVDAKELWATLRREDLSILEAITQHIGRRQHSLAA